VKNTLVIALFILALVSVCWGASEAEWKEVWIEAMDFDSVEREAEIPFGRVDVIADSFAIEVDYVSNFHNAIGQVLHYAYERKKKPGLALYIEGSKDKEKYLYVKVLAESLGIMVWLINDIVELTRTAESLPSDSIEYHGNVKSKIFHAPWCSNYNCKNCTAIFHSREEAEKTGYKPCKRCIKP